VFIAMNRFKIALGRESEFEAIWINRQSRLEEMPGFVSFKLLKGNSFESDGYTLYASHTIWATEADFQAWTRSDNFRDAHKNAGASRDLYLGPPVFEGFRAVDGA
jgi:heme-degrading monooxygenase HmoA